MKPVALACLALATLILGACHSKDGGWSPLGNSSRGRYLGVGIYRPEKAWSRLADANVGNGAAAGARTADDQAVIVLVDSVTGEVRACGDLSGYCIGMNPWRKDLAKSQMTPVILSPDTEGEGTPAASKSK
ncbi:MAG: hypothetical protein JSR45_05845 [Proteobacteria bacterium]|nr:hypothetical protein [Pseudomonadota bacterium]